MSPAAKVITALIILIIIIWMISWIIISLVCKFCQPDINHPDGGVKWQHLSWLTLIPVVLTTILVLGVVMYVLTMED